MLHLKPDDIKRKKIKNSDINIIYKVKVGLFIRCLATSIVNSLLLTKNFRSNFTIKFGPKRSINYYQM